VWRCDVGGTGMCVSVTAQPTNLGDELLVHDALRQGRLADATHTHDSNTNSRHVDRVGFKNRNNKATELIDSAQREGGANSADFCFAKFQRSVV